MHSFALPPEIHHSPLHHEDQLVAGSQQAVPQEARYFYGAGRIFDPARSLKGTAPPSGAPAAARVQR
jgi:hypothetical protein